MFANVIEDIDVISSIAAYFTLTTLVLTQICVIYKQKHKFGSYVTQDCVGFKKSAFRVMLSVQSDTRYI